MKRAKVKAPTARTEGSSKYKSLKNSLELALFVSGGGRWDFCLVWIAPVLPSKSKSCKAEKALWSLWKQELESFSQSNEVQVSSSSSSS